MTPKEQEIRERLETNPPIDYATQKEEYRFLLSIIDSLRADKEKADKAVYDLSDLLCSARTICLREGVGTAWKRFDERIKSFGIGNVTAKTFRVLPSDLEGESNE